MYKRMVDPEFAAAAKELGLEKQYTERLKSYGVALMETNVEQVNATNESSKYVDIIFNPNTQRYEATLNKSLVKEPEKVAAYLRARQTGNSRKAFASMPQDIPLEDLDAIAAGMDSIQKLNMINEGLVLALKTEKPGITGEDLAKELQQYTGTLKASYSKKDPWTSRAWDAIKTHIQENTDGTVNKRLQKESGGEDFGVVPEGDTNFNVQEDSLSSLGDDDAASILSFVSRAEGADYNTLFGGSKVILEEKTVAEVQQMQRAHGKKTGSSATGAYQVMRKTLSDLIDQGVVDPDEPFTEDVQNRIGMALLKRRGYDDWKSGKLSTDQFANRLAQEWASLPTASGKSAYEGVMGNKARTSRSELVSMLESLNT
jgi:muramidase (phage lysozyme)